MSQQDGFVPPPPPSNTSGGLGTPALAHSGNLSSQRRRPGSAQPQPPSIRTNFLRTHGVGSSSQPQAYGVPGHGTPFPYSPITPVAHDPRTPNALISQAASPGTPSTAMEPYNPRQWSQRQVSGAQRVYQRAANPSASTRDATGMEGTRMPVHKLSSEQRTADQPTYLDPLFRLC